jgi:Zn ribbon nucleic-acid-binding protein
VPQASQSLLFRLQREKNVGLEPTRGAIRCYVCSHKVLQYHTSYQITSHKQRPKNIEHRECTVCGLHRQMRRSATAKPKDVPRHESNRLFHELADLLPQEQRSRLLRCCVAPIGLPLQSSCTRNSVDRFRGLYSESKVI